jgi:hypothetical protein
MATTVGDGITLTQDAGLAVDIAGAAGRRRRSAALVEASADLDAGLAEADFEIAADFVVTPEAGSSRRSRASIDDAEGPPRLQVALEEDEGAVLLIEQQGGVHRWVWPAEQTAAPSRRRSGGAGRMAVFDLSPDASATDDGPTRRSRRALGIPLGGWIADELIEPVRVRVLRFVAAKTIDFAMDHVEGNLVEQALHWDRAARAWKPGMPALPQGRVPRILLMVHGTFSSTAGSFGTVPLTGPGTSVLAQAEDAYDAIIGFDHRTLGKTPLENAQSMLAALGALPAGTAMDSVAFSRGGLVLRSFELAAEQAGKGFVFGRAVFVGCTNAGTFLANPANWRALVDLYTTVTVSAARAISFATGFGGSAIIGQVIGTIGRFAKVLPELAIDDGKVPGLKAMQPDGDFVASLATPADALRRYRAITSDFRPQVDLQRGVTAEIVEFLADRVGDRFFEQPNDLVVHTASMTDFGSAGTLASGPCVIALPSAAQIYHTIYFGNDAVVDAIGRLLLGGDPVGAEPPAPEPREEVGFEPASPPLRRARRSRSGPPREMAGPPAGGAGPAKSLLPDPAMAGEAPAASPQQPSRQVECHFAAQIEADPPVNVPVKLGVTISPERIARIAGQVMDIADSSAIADTALPLVIEVTPLKNARLETEGRREVPVPDRSRTHWFLVTGFAPGEARIQVEVSQAGRTLALLLLEPVFVAEIAAPLVQGQTSAVGLSIGDEPVTLRIYEIEQPDGELLIRFNLESRRHNVDEVAELRGLASRNIDGFVDEFLTKLSDSYDLSPEEYALRKVDLLDLAAVTADQLLPESIRRALWKHRDQIEAIQVIADGSTIPWELLSVCAPSDDPSDEPGRFLAEWGVVRRLPGAVWPGPGLDLSAAKARYVIPDYRNDKDDLPYAQQEIGMLERLFPSLSSLEADSAKVREFLRTEAGQCSVLHFACHGSASQGAVLSAGLLMEEEGADGRLIDDVLTHNAVKQVARFAQEQPNGLVFLNACLAGRSGRNLLSNASGFADAFLRPKSRQGAAAFVGAMWEVDDQLALTFAETFYTALLAGKTFAAAANEARKKIQDQHDFTWLAYTFYGFPYARAV